MIIDADVHISPVPEERNRISINELLKIMDRSGVDKALTWLQPLYSRDVDVSNEYVYRATKEYPDRILGFGWVDPNLGVQKARDGVKKCINDYGFYGVKLNGAQNVFYIDDPVISIPIIEKVAETGKLLAFHIGADDYERTHPFRVGKIAKRFPDLKILMVHMGGVGVPDVTNATIEMAQEYPNLTLIGSNVRSKPILKAIRVLGASRVCFGSDTPFELMHVELAKYNALLDGELSQEDKFKVMAGNIIRLFSLGE